MKRVTKLMLESWVHVLEGEEQKYLKKKLRQLKREKLSTIIVEWFPEPNYTNVKRK